MNDSSKYRQTIIVVAAAVSLLLIFNGCDGNGGREVQGNVLSLRGTATFED